MKRSVFFLCLLLLFFSCKKENENNNNGGGTSNKKLIKQEFKSGQETGSFTYGYDAAGKLVSLRQESSGSGAASQGFRIYRNAAGMIQKLNYVDDGSRGDTLSIVVSSSGKQYTKAVETLTRNGTTFTTTSEFTYDNAGHIVATRKVQAYDNTPSPALIDEFTYQNNNLVAAKTYNMNSGTKTLVYQQAFAYDDKTNPLAFNDEWLLYSLTFTDFFWLASANNVTREQYMQPGSPDNIVNISYTYDNGLPLTATASSPGGGSSTAAFIYQ